MDTTLSGQNIISDRVLIALLQMLRSSNDLPSNDRSSGILSKSQKIIITDDDDTPKDSKYYESNGNESEIEHLFNKFTKLPRIPNKIESKSKDKCKRLTRTQELDIIHSFNWMLDNLFDVVELSISNQGYILHPLYIGMSRKYPLANYDDHVIGVRIDDSNFDYQHHKPSPNAIITEIIDIGGVDLANRGQIDIKRG